MSTDFRIFTEYDISFIEYNLQRTYSIFFFETLTIIGGDNMAFDFNDNRKVLLRAHMFEFMLIELVSYMKKHNKEDSEDFKELRAYIGEEMEKLITQSKKLSKGET